MALQGNIEHVDRHVLKGWVWEEDEPDRPVSVLAAVDGQPASRVLANAYRPDLEQASIGVGRHGFVVALGGLSPFEPHTVSLSREEDGAPIPGSPVTIPPLQRFDAEAQDALAAMLPDAASEEDLLVRATFLAQQADRLLQLYADRQAGRADPFAQRRFRARWSGRDALPRPGAERRVLVIDDTMPALDRDAGSHAIVSHMLSLRRLGLEVVFAPADTRGGGAAAALSDLGIAVCHAPWAGSVEEVLRREAGGFAFVYLHRVSSTRYLPLVRHHQPRARLVYSVADLHHLRYARQAVVEHRPELAELGRRVRIAELSAASGVDVVITHSSFEAALLRRELPRARVHVVPWAVPSRPVARPFGERRGLAFIGSYGHPPNLDAAWYLVQEVMPLVRALDPTLECLLVGSDMPDSLRAAGRPGLRMLGYVPDIAEVLSQVRLTVAPLLFGAGVKGKVLESLAAGVPCACTPVAAEGLDLPPALQALVAQAPADLARVVYRLHEDAAFNAECAGAGLDHVAAQMSEARLDGLLRESLRLPTG